MDYYDMQLRDYQQKIDAEAAFEYAVNEEIKEIEEKAHAEDEEIIEQINEMIDSNDDAELLQLAFGSGSVELFNEIRQRAVEELARQRVLKRMEG